MDKRTIAAELFYFPSFPHLTIEVVYRVGTNYLTKALATILKFVASIDQVDTSLILHTLATVP